MSDTTLNRFLAQGTNAERLAFVPDPPTPASGPDPGYLFFETDTDTLWSWDTGGAVWEQITSGSPFVNPMTTAEDLIVGGVGGTPDRLGVGSPGDVLTVGSGAIVDWEAPAPVDLTSDVTGILPVANGGTGTASPALVQGTNITITGSWPNQTINASGGGGTDFLVVQVFS